MFNPHPLPFLVPFPGTFVVGTDFSSDQIFYKLHTGLCPARAVPDCVVLVCLSLSPSLQLLLVSSFLAYIPLPVLTNVLLAFSVVFSSILKHLEHSECEGNLLQNAAFQVHKFPGVKPKPLKEKYSFYLSRQNTHTHTHSQRPSYSMSHAPTNQHSLLTTLTPVTSVAREKSEII